MSRTIELSQGWLHFPIGRDAARCYVRFEIDGRQIAELYLGLAPDAPDFWCGMELEDHRGKSVVLTITDGAPESLLDGIVEGPAMGPENPLYAGLYREELRPGYHFSSRRGWLNDPNGLVYDGEQYHLFYQHNPYGILHGGVNIHWGHAVSADAVHWRELPDGIRPWVSACHIASGSCLIDEDGVAGFGKRAMVAAFTHLGSANFRVTPPSHWPSEGQFLAASTDGGRHFERFAECPVIPTEDGKSWRDPRVFPDPEGGFGIAVYETDEKGNCVSFYHSDDLHRWTRTSRADDLYECPDLFRLTPVGGGAPKWVLYGADGMVRVGELSQGAFTQEGERYPLDYGLCTYAGQTWNGRDDSDGRMHISWLRDDKLSWSDPTSYPGMPFSQQMTVPCLLRLVKAADGYRVTRTPIPALDALRDGVPEVAEYPAAPERRIALPVQGDALLEIDSPGPVTLSLGIARIDYDPRTGEAVFDGGKKRAVLMERGPLRLRLLTDRMSSEFFLQDEISASYGQQMDGLSFSIEAPQGASVRASIYRMKGIW